MVFLLVQNAISNYLSWFIYRAICIVESSGNCATALEAYQALVRGYSGMVLPDTVLLDHLLQPLIKALWAQPLTSVALQLLVCLKIKKKEKENTLALLQNGVDEWENSQTQTIANHDSWGFVLVCLRYLFKFCLQWNSKSGSVEVLRQGSQQSTELGIRGEIFFRNVTQGKWCEDLQGRDQVLSWQNAPR